MKIRNPGRQEKAMSSFSCLPGFLIFFSSSSCYKRLNSYAFDKETLGMQRTCCFSLFLACAVAAPCWAAEAYSIKTATNPAPKELKGPIAQLLSDRSVQLLDEKGNLLAEIWFRKDVPAKATPAQIKNGLTYRELEETTLLGAMRLEQPMTDFRKQKIKPGVYTLRLGFQPMDGDHQGTSPYPEFCLLSPADADAKPDLMPAKDLQEQSAKASGGSHPSVWLLFPNEKPEDAPKLANKGGGNWVLGWKEPVTVGAEKAFLGVGLTLIGHAE
jgi:hypothetical protein